MKIGKMAGMFCLGGAAYVGLELLWRRRSHVSMFAAGGTCFLMLGQLRKTNLPLPAKAAAGAVGITAVELAAGLAANRQHQVWDYRQIPLNYRGQICLPYSLLWVPVSLGGMALYGLLDQ